MPFAAKRLGRSVTSILSGALLVALALSLAASGAQATTYYWDADAAAGTGGTAWNGAAGRANLRSWNTVTATDNLWWSGTTTPDILWNNVTNLTDIAAFGWTAGTVDTSGTINAGGLIFDLTFGGSAYTLNTGGTITLANATGASTAGTIVSNQVNGAVINSALAGGNGITISGTGSMTLGGTNTFTGGLNINGSVVKVGALGNLNGNAITLNNGSIASGRFGALGGLYATASITNYLGNMTTGASGGVIDVANTTTFTLGNGAGLGLLSTGAGALYKTNRGVLNLNNDNSGSSFSGGIIVNGGQIRSNLFNSASANPFGNSAANYTLNAVGSLYAQSAAAGAAPATLGNLTVAGGNMLVVDASGTGANTLQLTFNSLVRSNNGTLIVNAIQSNLGTAGTGREKVFFTGTAPTTYNGGTMIAPWAVYTPTATANTAPTFLTYGVVNGLAPAAFNQNGLLGALPAHIVDVTVADTALTSAGLTVYALRTNSNITTDGAADGTLTIGDGTYGGLLINGNLTIGSATAGSKVTVDFGAAEGVIFTRDGQTGVIGNVITGSNGFTKFGNGTLTLGLGAADFDPNAYTGTVRVNGGTLNLSKAADTLAITGDLVIGPGANIGSVTGTKGQVTFTTGAGSNQIASTSNVTLLDGSDLNLNGLSNTLASLTFIGSGRVQTGAGTLTLGGNITATSGDNSNLNPNGYAQITGLLSLGGVDRTITVNPGPNSPATFNMEDLRIAAVISDGGAPTASGIIKEGNGQLYLSTANTFTGAVTINAGTVKLGNALALGTAAAGTAVAGGATLDVNGQSPAAEALTLNGTGVGSRGALVEYTNNVNASTWGGTVNLNTSSSIGVYGTRMLFLGGIVSGAGNLTKVGAGVLEVTNTGNIFTGQIIINEGTLQIKNGTLGLPASGNEPILLGDTSGTANANLRSAWDTNPVINRGITVQAGSSGYAMLGGWNGRHSFVINGALTLNKDLIVNTSSEQGSGNITLGSTSTISGAGGIIKTSLNGTGTAFGNNYAMFIYQGATTPTHAFTTIYAGLVRWERNTAVALGGDIVSFGNGNITLAANLLDNTGKYAPADFELYATQSGATPEPVTLTNNIVVSGPGGGSLYGWQDNSGGKPNITFSGTIDLAGTLGVGSRTSGSDATPLHYTGTVTMNQAALGARVLAGGAQTVAAQMEGDIVDGAGSYKNPLMVYTNAGTLTIAGTNNTYAGGTVILPTTGWVAVAAASKLGTGNVAVLPGGRLQINATSNINTGSSITLLGSPAANGVVSVTGDYVPSIADGASGILAIDTTSLSSVTPNGTMSLSSTLGAVAGGAFPATVTIGAGGVYTGATLAACPDGNYRLGGLNGNLNIANGVLVGSNNLIVKGINPVFNATGTAINQYGKWFMTPSQVTLQAANSFTGSITVKHGILAGSALASDSPFGNIANTVTLNNGTLQVNGTASATTFTAPAVTFDGLGTISAVKGPAASLALTVPSVTRVNNSVMVFTGTRDPWNLQFFPTFEKIFVTAGLPATTNNMLPPSYSFAGTDFANYDVANGVTKAVYTRTTAGNPVATLSGAALADIVYTTANQTDIDAPVSVYAYNAAGGTSAVSGTTGLGSLTIGSGGFIGSQCAISVPVTFTDEAIINVVNSDNNQPQFLSTVTTANGLTKFGPGSLQLGSQATNVDYNYLTGARDPNFTTLVGTITVLGGQLSLNVPQFNGANQIIDDSAFGPNTNLIVLNGGVISVGGTDGVWFRHDFRIDAAGGTFANNSGNIWNSYLTGNISGTGQVVFDSAGGRAAGECSWYISGPNNSYTGGTIIANSSQFDGATVAPASSLGTGDVYVQTNAILLLQGNANIGSTDGVNITRQARITTDGIVQFKSATPSIGSLAGGMGSVVLGSNGGPNSQSNTLQPYSPATTTLLTVGGDNTSTTFYGVISEVNTTTAQGSLTKIGTGKLSLWGVNTYTGATAVNNGTLAVNGSLASTTVTVGDLTAPTVTATLAGSGIIVGLVTVNANGNLAPGASAGTITLGNGLNMSAAAPGGANMTWELAALSTSPGNFDFVNLTGGDLVLGGASNLTLDFNLLPSGQQPGNGDTFWNTSRSWKIIDTTLNSGNTNFITWTNNTFGSATFTTTVGDGVNAGDILLNYAPGVGPVDATWATNTDGNWSTPLNWTPGVPSGPGTTARFTGNGQFAVNVNGAQTVGSVLLTSSTGYTISGSALTLNNTGGTGGNAAISATAGSHQIASQVITAATNLDVSAVSGGSLNLSGGINNAAAVVLGLTQSEAGTLSVGDILNAGTMNVSGTVGVGDVSGAGTTSVAASASLTADSILQDTLSIVAGGTVTIRPTTAGPFAGGFAGSGSNNPSQVPEPGTWVLLIAGAACLLPLLRRRRGAA